MIENRGIWQNESPEKKVKPLQPTTMRGFGLDLKDIKNVKDLQELRETPPNIIIAEAKKTFSFTQNYFKQQTLQKKKRYVMSLGVFQQLQLDQSKRNKVKLLVPATIRFKNIYKPYLGQDATDKTILIFRTGGIGDLLFIQPNLLYLKEKYPTCKIKFACGPQYQPMVMNWDCVDEVLDLPFLVSHLLTSDYHMVFEGVIERCNQAEEINSYNLFTEWLGLNLPNEKLIPKQIPKSELVDESFKILKGWGLEENSFILMQLRASSPIRTPKHEFWLKIINELNNRGHKVLLTDSPRQAPSIDNFIKLLDKADMTFNFCQYSKSIDYTIALASLCKATFATDSSLGHIAASLDKKTFGIYGPFPGHIRLSTYPNSAWVDAQKECAPCYIHSQSPCPKASFDGYSPCYDELIETDEKLNTVIDKFEELLNK
jgi:ADP-heptose:LPS heptosyltransferase